MKHRAADVVATDRCAWAAHSAQSAACRRAGAGQAWPTRPLRVVVPFTAGSATDIIGRIRRPSDLSSQLGHNFVVENRPGAGGTIGVGVVAKAEPDGYTILVHSSSFTVTPSTYPNLPYNTLRDFSGITPLANLPNVLVIAPSRGHTLGEGPRRGGEGEARHDHLRLGRRGQRDAVERRAFPSRRGLRRRARAVQGHARSARRRDDRPRRFLFLPGDRGAAVPQGRKAARARRRQHEARLGAARSPDDARSGHPELGLQLLGRHDGAREDPARHRDEAASEHAARAAGAGHERAHGETGRGADAHDAAGVRRLHQEWRSAPTRRWSRRPVSPIN